MIERDKGFIAGACEDGTLYFQKSKNNYLIEIEQKNKQWLEEVKSAFFRAYLKNPIIKQRKTGYYRLICYSKSVYDELLALRADFSALKHKPLGFQLGFLQGMFDAEGSVHKVRNNIRLYSKNAVLVSAVKEILGNAGIDSGKVHVDKRTNVLALTIYGKDNLLRFARLINFKHPAKFERLNMLLRDPQNRVVSCESSLTYGERNFTRVNVSSKTT